MKNKKYNVFVIGSGAAGKKVAEDCKSAGLTVAISEKKGIWRHLFKSWL